MDGEVACFDLFDFFVCPVQPQPRAMRAFVTLEALQKTKMDQTFFFC